MKVFDEISRIALGDKFEKFYDYAICVVTNTAF